MESTSQLPARISCDGNLPSLTHDSFALLTADGDVVVASANGVSTYHLDEHGWRARHQWSFTHPVTALAESPLGVLVAAGSQLHCASADTVRQVAHLDGIVRSLAGAGTTAFAAVGRTGRLDGMLVEVDLLQAMIVSQQSLRSARVTLATDSTHSYLSIGDGQTLQTRRIRASQPCLPIPDGGAATPAPPPSDPACHCQDSALVDATSPAPNPRPPAEPCDPAQSGVPTPDGGRVVGDGDGVTKHPPGDGRTPNPCRSHLFFQVQSVRLAGAYVIASDRQGHHVAVLAAEDLQVLHQIQSRKGTVLLVHPAQARMLMFDRRTGSWSDTAFDRLPRRPLEVPLQPLQPLEPNIFTGTSLQTLRGTRAPAIGIKKVLVLPAIDPAQAFNDADLPKLAAYLRRAAFTPVADYYREASFGLLKDIQYSVYGVDVGTGGPLHLPRPIASYYNPAYVGAHVDMRKAGLTFPATLVFDGRERMTLDVKPQNGGRMAATLEVKFSSLILSGAYPLYPAQVHFAGTETCAITVVLPDGNSKVLSLSFPALTLNIANNSELAGKLPQLEGYLDGVFAAAESAAGIPPRLFTRPALRRVNQGTQGPGLLVTSLSHTVATGPRLQITRLVYVGATDPLGLLSPISGTLLVTAGNDDLKLYLDYVTVLAQEAAGFDVNQRRLADNPLVVVNGDTLTCSLFISDEDGGPGATFTLSNPVNLEGLFDSFTSSPNSDVTVGRSNTTKDGEDGFDGLIDDLFTAAVDRLAAPGQHLAHKAEINQLFQGFEAVLVGVVHPADSAFVRPEETWFAGPTSWVGLRAEEGPRTAHFRPNPADIQFFSNWNLVPLEVPPPFLVFAHEFGHALGFGDLYKREAGYRDDLLYMGAWSIMDDGDSGSHHCGYNKWEAGWIDDSRVKTLPRPADTTPVSYEVLLVPVEYWPGDDSIIGAARDAFGLPAAEVVQLIELELGGDADVFGLIEARQKGVTFSQRLPAQPALLVTNCIVFWDPNRYAFEHRYRASVHPLHGPDQLAKIGASFDLALGQELPAKGIVVTLLDRKTVGGIEVSRVQVVRQNSNNFIDLFFSTGNPYYKNPDLWVDWAGNNGADGKSSDSADDVHIYPLDQPKDQGEQIMVPKRGTELHWMVARLRNIGNTRADQVKVDFSVCEPPGAGDRGNFKVRDTVLLDSVQPTGRDNPIFVKSKWPIPAGFAGHTCIMVEIADLKVPLDETGAALASDDVTQANNRAQKNVDNIGPAHESPFEPVPFEFSVNNSGEWPEVAYLEPEGLPFGMQLTVMPKRRRIAAGETAIFRCSLQLDDQVIDTSCLGDHDFRINVWRVDQDASLPWGGVEYQVRPRKLSRTDLSASWDFAGVVQVKGHVAPGNIVGKVRIRLAYTGLGARWVSADLKPGGTFDYQEQVPAGTSELRVMALFEGNKFYSESRSTEKLVQAPPRVN